MPIVVKGDGSREEFDPSKLERSLRHSGADEGVARGIVPHRTAESEDGMPTDIIYKHAFKLLRREESGVAARYSMRRAILELGPTGFPFEDFFSALMRAKGYQTRRDIMVRGRCVEHEVDVVLDKDGRTIGAEL
ncbi:MAG: ATP cone domain-containing protein, partial [Patescibacteria group bacterium]